MTMTAKTAEREQSLRELTAFVGLFDPNSKVQKAHFQALAKQFGDFWAAMLVGQDVADSGLGQLQLTDPGEINTWAGWREVNRVVRHGAKARFYVYDFDADTKVGGRVLKMFTRGQTVPAYSQD
jgi:hypothetical protein